MPSHYYPVNVELDGLKTKIHFLKLGLVQNESYAEEVLDYIKFNHSEVHSERVDKCETTTSIEVTNPPVCGMVGAWPLRRETCSFPFSGTFLTCYSGNESKAYRFLGKHLITSLIRNSDIKKRFNP